MRKSSQVSGSAMALGQESEIMEIDELANFEDSLRELLSQEMVDTSSIKNLIERTDTKQRNDKGETALHIACKLECISAVGFLIERGADVNAVDRWQNTSAHFAAENYAISEESRKILDILKANGANCSMKNKNEMTVHRLIFESMYEDRQPSPSGYQADVSEAETQSLDFELALQEDEEIRRWLQIDNRIALEKSLLADPNDMPPRERDKNAENYFPDSPPQDQRDGSSDSSFRKNRKRNFVEEAGSFHGAKGLRTI